MTSTTYDEEAPAVYVYVYGSPGGTVSRTVHQPYVNIDHHHR